MVDSDRTSAQACLGQRENRLANTTQSSGMANPGSQNKTRNLLLSLLTQFVLTLGRAGSPFLQGSRCHQNSGLHPRTKGASERELLRNPRMYHRKRECGLSRAVTPELTTIARGIAVPMPALNHTSAPRVTPHEPMHRHGKVVLPSKVRGCSRRGNGG